MKFTVTSISRSGRNKPSSGHSKKISREFIKGKNRKFSKVSAGNKADRKYNPLSILVIACAFYRISITSSRCFLVMPAGTAHSH